MCLSHLYSNVRTLYIFPIFHLNPEIENMRHATNEYFKHFIVDG